MDRLRYRQMFVNVASLAVLSVLDFRPLVIGGALKLAAFLVLSYLLLFAVVNSSNLERLIVTCLRTLPALQAAPVVEVRWIEWPSQSIPALRKANRQSLFQRPPPFLLHTA